MGRQVESERSYNNGDKESGLTALFSLIITLVIVGVIYHKEIINWLYAHEMWLIPIAIK